MYVMYIGSCYLCVILFVYSLLTVIRLLNVVYASNLLKVFRVLGARFGAKELSSVAVGDEAAISDDNTIAYFPDFDDVDTSGMAAGLLNLYNIFSCVKDAAETRNTTVLPLCRVQHFVESGFLNGEGLVLIGDDGRNITVFGEDVPSLAFGVRGCPEFTTRRDGCLRGSFQFTISCIMPGRFCAGKNIANI